LEDVDEEQLLATVTDTEPDLDLEVSWSQVVITGTLLNMRNECYSAGRHATWEIFVERCLEPELAESTPTPYEDLIQRHDLDSPSDAFNLLASAKRMFQRHMRTVVAEYAGSNAEIDEELDYLHRKLCLLGSR
jgi:hypothetical protein